VALEISIFLHENRWHHHVRVVASTSLGAFSYALRPCFVSRTECTEQLEAVRLPVVEGCIKIGKGVNSLARKFETFYFPLVCPSLSKHTFQIIACIRQGKFQNSIKIGYAMLRRNTSHLLPCKMFDIMGRTHDTAVVFEALRHFTFAIECLEGNIPFVATGDRTYLPLVLQGGSSAIAVSVLMVPPAPKQFEGGRTIPHEFSW